MRNARRGRLNARLEPELGKKLASLRRRTGLGTSDVVRTSIERYYETVRVGGTDARAVLEVTGFLASGEGPADLSERYKEHLVEGLVIAAEQLGSGRVFSTDQRDFGAYRWKDRKPFQNLLRL